MTGASGMSCGFRQVRQVDGVGGRVAIGDEGGKLLGASPLIYLSIRLEPADHAADQVGPAAPH
jgi:hypothetical protein